MCCLTDSEKNILSDIDSLRSEIRDKSVRVIDVRRENDYKQDHIPDSVNLPLANLLSDDSPERVLKLINSMGIDDETRVVVYDDTFGALASDFDPESPNQLFSLVPRTQSHLPQIIARRHL